MIMNLICKLFRDFVEINDCKIVEIYNGFTDLD